MSFLAENPLETSFSSVTSEPGSQKSSVVWSESDFCLVCRKEFSKIHLVLKHHCRLCGIPVCDQCSKHRHLSLRCCSICQLRLDSQDLLTRQARDLVTLDETIIELEKNAKEMENKVKKTKEEAREMEGNIDGTLKMNDFQLSLLKKEVTFCINSYKEKMKEYEIKKQELDKNTEEEENGKKMLADLTKKIREEEDKIKKKRKQLSFNEEHLKNTKSLYEKLKTSESYKCLVDLQSQQERIFKKYKPILNIFSEKEKEFEIPLISKIEEGEELRLISKAKVNGRLLARGEGLESTTKGFAKERQGKVSVEEEVKRGFSFGRKKKKDHENEEKMEILMKNLKGYRDESEEGEDEKIENERMRRVKLDEGLKKGILGCEENYCRTY